MEGGGILGLATLGLVLGCTHAFDADHILAVTSLANRKANSHKGARYALKWALGHGALLLAVAVLALVFKQKAPDSVVALAEKAVGLILIATGIAILVNLARNHIGLRAHQHGEVIHAHLTSQGRERDHDHSPLLVGMVHGLAGSGPALAVIPVTFQAPAMGLAYVVIFSLGVLAGMLFFGLLLGRLQRLIASHGHSIEIGVRGVLGAATAAFGVFWLA